MAGDAPFIVNDQAGVAAAPFAITNKIKQLRVRNAHATNTLTVAMSSSNSSSTAAKSAASTGAGVAVIGADDNWTIPPGQSAVVWKSNSGRFVAISVIASGAATPFVAEGTIWKD